MQLSFASPCFSWGFWHLFSKSSLEICCNVFDSKKGGQCGVLFYEVDTMEFWANGLFHPRTCLYHRDLVSRTAAAAFTLFKNPVGHQFFDIANGRVLRDFRKFRVLAAGELA